MNNPIPKYSIAIAKEGKDDPLLTILIVLSLFSTFTPFSSIKYKE